MKRGEIYFAALDPTQGSEIRKTRPVVIVSNNVANRHAAVVTVVPLTSNTSSIYPFEVKLTAPETGLNKDSKALVQQIRALDRSRLDSAPKGLIPMARMQEVDNALRLHLAL